MTKLFLAAALSLFCAAPVLAQVDYRTHPHYPYYSENTTPYASGRINATDGYVNGRQGPGTNHRAIASFYPGEYVQVYKAMRGSDGRQWFLLYAPGRDQAGWVRHDLLRLI